MERTMARNRTEDLEQRVRDGASEFEFHALLDESKRHPGREGDAVEGLPAGNAPAESLLVSNKAELTGVEPSDAVTKRPRESRQTAWAAIAFFSALAGIGALGMFIGNSSQTSGSPAATNL